MEGYSLLVLAIGPALHQLARATNTMLAALNGLVYVAMGGGLFDTSHCSRKGFLKSRLCALNRVWCTA